MSVFDIFLWFS